MAAHDMDETRAVFDRFDKDKSNQIELRELARILEALGMEPDDEEVDAAMVTLDKDKSGRVSWDEFRVWFEAL